MTRLFRSVQRRARRSPLHSDRLPHEAPSNRRVAATKEQKQAVEDFWNAGACGEVYAQGELLEERLGAQAAARYRLEPYIKPFARFAEGTARDVLEIGVGMGADHVEWARSNPNRLVGVDLTERAIAWTRNRVRLVGLKSQLHIADAESLPFPDDSFDIVYSWGVLHHTPDTEQAFSEVHRVLRPGGVARIMIYHAPSVVGFLLWLRYGLAIGRPRRLMSDIYANHLESPGTKAFTVEEARHLVRKFALAEHQVQLSFGDLLQGAVGQQHDGAALRLAKRFWPRRFLERTARGYGLTLLIEATK